MKSIPTLKNTLWTSLKNDDISINTTSMEIEKHPHVLLLSHLFDKRDESIAKSIVKPDTRDFYLLRSCQHTVYQHNSAPIEGILTEFGLNMYQSACRDAELGKFKGSFTSEYRLDSDHSGNWFPDKASEHYSPDEDGMLNSFENIVVVGKLDGADLYTRTSPCIFIKRNEWVLTKSGSLYDLSKGQETTF
jgi:hypothetical protein